MDGSKYEKLEADESEGLPWLEEVHLHGQHN